MARSFSLTVFAVILLAAPTSADDKSADDIKKLQGEWRYVEVEIDGKQISFDSHPVWKDRRLVFHDATGMTGKPGKAGAADRESSFKLDANQSPKAIDITALDGKESGTTWACIYTFDKERFRICMPNFPQADPSKRPKEFQTKDGDGLMLLVLERVDAK